MHELSVAQSIIDGTLDELGLHPDRRVAKIHLEVGCLSGVGKEALLFAYNLASKGTPLEGSQLEIEGVDAAVLCRNCDAERELASIPDFSCPVCHTPTAEVVRGREILITYLELMNPPAAETA
ncbi:MAG TPA: hydrogenase maturation nickel metallochaperone HypA [Pyrinomonadaceae bacterium]|nr:hydrogenase maturation nickel metallochaperone HypA [Pyrinomonadaceae bacterium]